MRTIVEIRAERVEVLNNMKALLAKAKTENRGLNGEETAEFDKLDKEAARLKQLVENEERMLGIEAELQTPEPAKTAEPTQRRAAGNESQKGFATFGEQLLAIRAAASPGAVPDPRLLTRAATGSNTEVPSDGGFLVQKDFLNELLKNAYDRAPIAGRCRRIPVSGNGIVANGIDETSRVNGSRFGGIRAYWAGEADQKTASRPKFRQIDMTLQKLIGLWYATDELLADAAALDSIAREAFADEMAFVLDDAIYNGDGVGKPLGFMQSPSLVTVAIESGPQTTDTVVVQNIVKMRARLWARSRPNAVWLYNQDIEPQLHLMTLGGTNANLPVYLPGGTIAGTPYDTLMGIPAIPVEQAATLGDVGDISLVDLSQYMLIEKGGMQSDVSIHVRFIYDESVFRFVMRVNGQPIWHSPLTPFKGSATQSPFITLATR